MKNILSPLLIIWFSSSFAQTIIIEEHFEIGSTTLPFWQLNTSDEGSGSNLHAEWKINNVYLGGIVEVEHYSLPFPIVDTIPDVPNQPGEIVNSPNSYYLHMTDDIATSFGVNCASFLYTDAPLDLGIPSQFGEFFARSPQISTEGYTDVEVSFWWLGGVSPAIAEIYYTTDNSTTWNLLETGFTDQTNWAQVTISDTALNNKPSIRFGFKCDYSISGPSEYLELANGFSLDDFIVTGTAFISNITEDNSVKLNLFPNPTAATITVKSELQIERIEIRNTLGQMILESIEKNIDVSQFENGSYLISITTDQGVITKRFIKE